MPANRKALRGGIAHRYGSKKLLNSSLKENFFSELNPLDAGFFFLVEVETEHISRVQAEVIQIFADLFFTGFMVTLSMSDFQLDDVLLSEIIDDHIGAGLVSGLGFNVIIPCPVDDRPQIQKE